jgi:ribonuclease T2
MRSLPFTLATVLVLSLAFASAADARHRHRPPDTGAAPGQFDYYLLSLSWSPSYCLTHPDDRPQCGGKGFGFVLHGLWPQYDRGGFPEACGDTELDARARDVGRTIFVSPRLMEHEWERHGTCSGLPAVDYFRTADRAVGTVAIPRAFDAPRQAQSMTAEEIVRAFRQANPRWPDGAITVACGRGQLSEVRICLTRDLAPRTCGRGVRSSCPTAPVEVQAVR